MKKSIIFATILSISIILFSAFSFATDNMIDDIANSTKNVMNGAGNIVSDITSGIGEGVSNIGNGMQNMSSESTTNNMNNNYIANRTSTNINNTKSTFLGMGSTAWGWLIMSIVGIIIVSLVWFYGKQHEDDYTLDNEDDY